MATILDTFRATDGWDITVELFNGEKRVFHFVQEPPDIQAAVDEIEDKLRPPEIVIIAEDGSIVGE